MRQFSKGNGSLIASFVQARTLMPNIVKDNFLVVERVEEIAGHGASTNGSPSTFQVSAFDPFIGLAGRATVGSLSTSSRG